MAADLPWFPLYVSDLQTDEAYLSLSHAQRGMYLDLLCWQWIEGSIPAGLSEIARRLGIRRSSDKIRLESVLKLCFIGDGTEFRLVNPRLAEVRAHQIDRSDKARANAMRRHYGRIGSQSQIQIQSQIKKSLSASALPKTKTDLPREIA